MHKSALASTPLLDGMIDVTCFSPERKEEARYAVMEIAEQAANADERGEKRISDPVAFIDACIARLDAKLSEQLSEVIHHPVFTKLEGSWRGLAYLTNQAETGASLKIKVLDASREELLRDCEEAPDFKKSALFRKIYGAEYNTYGGEPYAAIIGDYEFDHSPESVALLKHLAQTAAAAHAPLVSAASPSLFGLKSHTSLGNLEGSVAQVFQQTEYAGWRALRDSEDSRYVALTLPRVLARLPYGAETVRVPEFAFEEEVDADGQDSFVWMNAAYALGARFADAFAQNGWCVQFRGAESGGMVEDLPTYTYVSDRGNIEMKCPTEVTISDALEYELSANGFISLVHKKNENCAVFFSGQTLQKPKVYNEHTATASADLSAKLPYVMAVSRIAHYLKVLMRDKIAGIMEREDAEKFLDTWIKQYVSSDLRAGPEQRAKMPLREAKVEVKEIPGRPGCYHAVAFLRPHFQLEEIHVSLRLVAEMPTKENK